MTLATKIREAVEAEQKHIAFEIKQFKPDVIVKRICREIERLHEPGMYITAGDLEVVQCSTTNFDSLKLFARVKEVAAKVDALCHVEKVAVRGFNGNSGGYEIKFSFYDKPESHKYRGRGLL